MNPTVGRIVHYVSFGSPGGEFVPECRAAVVTAVEEGSIVSLAVLNPNGLYFNQGALLNLSHAGGTWHWPERE